MDPYAVGNTVTVKATGVTGTIVSPPASHHNRSEARNYREVRVEVGFGRYEWFRLEDVRPVDSPALTDR